MVAFREEPEVWADAGSTEFSKVVHEDAVRSIGRMLAGGGSSLLYCLQVRPTKAEGDRVEGDMVERHIAEGH